jgi:hypothetical protein
MGWETHWKCPDCEKRGEVRLLWRVNTASIDPRQPPADNEPSYAYYECQWCGEEWFRERFGKEPLQKLP